MHLLSYEFRELENTARAWAVDRFDVDMINLFVGVNSSGKTRIVSSIEILAKVLTSRIEYRFDSCHWIASFKSGKDRYDIEIQFEDRAVFSEKLILNGKIKLERGSDGSGRVWYEELKDYIPVKARPEDLLIATRRDELQHPYLNTLVKWATGVRLYKFSSDLGRGQIWNYKGKHEIEDALAAIPLTVTDPNRVVEQYARGWKSFGDKFDKAILKDLKSVGYDCESIGADYFEIDDLSPSAGELPIQLAVKERSIKGLTRQTNMSTGMFRALSIIIHLNFIALDNSQATILLDDIGEGLDYERAASLVRIVIKRCKSSKIQLIMTSNDRFVMNAVDLDYWHIITRKSSIVRVSSKSNNPGGFEGFSYLGLSNFDFFKSQAHD